MLHGNLTRFYSRLVFCFNNVADQRNATGCQPPLFAWHASDDWGSLDNRRRNGFVHGRA